MKFVNLTSHIIRYQFDGKLSQRFNPSGLVLRLKQPKQEITNVNGYEVSLQGPFTEIDYDMATFDIEPDTIYIVSNPFAEFIKHPQFWAPDVSPESVIRDEHGNITAVNRFRRYEAEPICEDEERNSDVSRSQKPVSFSSNPNFIW